MTHCVVVLDDDPTGTQAVAGAQVLVDISADALHAWFAGHAPQPVYVSTNTRALPGDQARDLVARVAGIAAEQWPAARFICRGDSTLRGHILEEYQALARGASPVLLLAPAMPAAGRVTIDGRHYLATAAGRVPIAETEYARDPDLGYSRSDVLGWAEERSGGFFAASRGAVLSLAELRRAGASRVAAKLASLAGRGQPAALSCDAENDADLLTVASGVRQAWRQATPVVVRSAPPLAALLAGLAAAGYSPPPAAARRLLVVVGSYVQASTLQLAELGRAYPGQTVVADLGAIRRDPAREQRRLAGRLDQAWGRCPVAVLATPRDPTQARPVPGLSIARSLAAVVAALPTRPDAVIVRGGVTSAVVARYGLGAREARVTGPVGPGVALWQLDDGAGGGIPLLIAAGNVGQPEDLAVLVRQMAGDPDRASGTQPGRREG